MGLGVRFACRLFTRRGENVHKSGKTQAKAVFLDEQMTNNL